MNANWFDAIRVLSLPLLIGLNGYFVAAEFAHVKVGWTRVEELVRERRFGAAAVRHAIENLDDAMAACQLGITVAGLGLGWLGEPALAHRIEPLCRDLPGHGRVTRRHGVAGGLA